MTRDDRQALEIEVRDKIADGFENWYLGKGYYYQWIEFQHLKRALALNPDETLLDAGCGTGRLARYLAAFCRRVIAVDFSPKSLEVLRREAERERIGNITTHVVDLKKPMPFSDKADKAISVQVIEHIPERALRVVALENVRAALVPGGRCVVTVYNWNARYFARGLQKEGIFPSGVQYFRFTPREAAAHFRDAGFKDVKISGLVNFKGYGRGGRIFSILSKLDLLLSRTPVSLLFGDFLVITATA